MRAVIKRVSAAQVTIKSDLQASIRRGLCVLVAFHKNDTWDDVEYIMKKILYSKLFTSSEGEMERSVVEEGLEILCVSQPALFAVVKETGLEYPDAMSDDRSHEFFDVLITTLENLVGEARIRSSTHGDYMEVDFDNDGAVTVMLDSRESPEPAS